MYTQYGNRTKIYLFAYNLILHSSNVIIHSEHVVINLQKKKKKKKNNDRKKISEKGNNGTCNTRMCAHFRSYKCVVEYA